METPCGAVPRAKTSLSTRDKLGTLRARVGVIRNRYNLNPGLYCVGSPRDQSPVLVTANYKLSFDSLRQELSTIDAWILVVDTRGINVWCAAGKGTFSDDEIAMQVQKTRLSDIVAHRELILPQFAAPGVASYKLKKKCGFKARFGPIRAVDLLEYLSNGQHADEKMRTVTFTFGERLILTPVEIYLFWKPFLFITLAILVLSGLGPDFYSISTAINRGMFAIGATIVAMLTGALVTPVFLPWIPGRQFWWKGALAGSLTGFGYIILNNALFTTVEAFSLWSWIVAGTSYLAMNFTGATPYTSLSGVKKEMQQGLPVQCGVTFLALLLWLASPFIS